MGVEWTLVIKTKKAQVWDSSLYHYRVRVQLKILPLCNHINPTLAAITWGSHYYYLTEGLNQNTVSS